MADDDDGLDVNFDGGKGGKSKEIALVIVVLAMLLALTDLLGQSAQMLTLQTNIEASNLWGFYQAKAIRQTILETSADGLEANLAPSMDADQRKALQERITHWRADASRYESDPATKEGRRELRDRATAIEHERDEAERKHKRYKPATVAFHIAIVLASSAIITGVMLLLRGALIVGGLGCLFLLAGLLA